MRFKVNLKSYNERKKAEKETYKKNITRESIFLAKIAWMRYYQWKKGDTPFGSFDYLKNMNWIDNVADISENNNFFNFNGMCFGSFQTKGKIPKLEKIEGSPQNSDFESIDDILVIFCSSNPERKGKNEVNIVGWYSNATVYREYQYNRDYDIYYNIFAKSKNCVLLSESERKDNKIWFLPQIKGSEINFGQSMWECQKFCVSPIASRFTTPFSKSLTQKNLHSHLCTNFQKNLLLNFKMLYKKLQIMKVKIGAECFNLK